MIETNKGKLQPSQFKALHSLITDTVEALCKIFMFSCNTPGLHALTAQGLSWLEGNLSWPLLLILWCYSVVLNTITPCHSFRAVIEPDCVARGVWWEPAALQCVKQPIRSHHFISNASNISSALPLLCCLQWGTLPYRKSDGEEIFWKQELSIKRLYQNF